MCQVELHPYLQQRGLVGYAQSLGMVVTAFSPLGNGRSYWQEVYIQIIKSDFPVGYVQYKLKINKFIN